MVTWSKRTRTVRTVEYVIPTYEPWGADWIQVNTAIHAALKDYADSHNGRQPSDNCIRFHPGDDEIILTFEVSNDKEEK